jgi:hypothetical protein
MTPVAHEACAACVGIDGAEATHDGGLQAASAAPREGLTLAHTPEAIAAWGSTLRRRFPGQPSAVCRALNHGPLGSALRTEACLVLLPLTPLTLARDRDACPPRRAQDAPAAAALPLARFLTPRDTLQPLQPQSPPLRALDQRVAHRRRVVADRGRLTTRLTSPLQHYGPQVLPWFPDQGTRLCCDVLGRGPPLNAAQLARRATLATFFRDHHARSADVMAQRRHASKTAPP